MNWHKLIIGVGAFLTIATATADEGLYLICNPVEARSCSEPSGGCDPASDLRRVSGMQPFAIRRENGKWSYLGTSNNIKLREFRAEGSGVEEDVYSFEVTIGETTQIWALSRRTGQLVTYAMKHDPSASKPVLETTYQCKKEDRKF